MSLRNCIPKILILKPHACLKLQWKKEVLREVTRPRDRENHGNNRTTLIYTVVTLKYVVEFILKHLTNLQHYTPGIA